MVTTSAAPVRPARRVMIGSAVSAVLLAITTGLFLGVLGGGGFYDYERSGDGSWSWRGTDDKRSVLIESALCWYDEDAAVTNPALGRLLELADRPDTLDRASIRTARTLMREASQPATAPTGSAEIWWSPSLVAQHETFGAMELRSSQAGQSRGEALLEVSPSVLKDSIIRVGTVLQISGPLGEERFVTRSWMTLKDGTGVLLDLGPIDADGAGNLLLLLSATKITG